MSGNEIPQERFDELYRKYIEPLPHHEMIGHLVYFFQYVDLHKSAMASNRYAGGLTSFQRMEQQKETSIFGNYGVNLLESLVNEQNPIRQIELMLAYENLLEDFMALTDALGGPPDKR